MVLQTWKAVSITNGTPTLLLPIVFVLLVTALKDMVEDYRRHKSDDEENLQHCDVLRGDQFMSTLWKDVKIGDVVMLRNRETIPADMAMLACNDKNNLVYVMTANLDGETNLKLRTVQNDLPEDYKSIKGKLECDLPNKFLDVFNGTLTSNQVCTCKLASRVLQNRAVFFAFTRGLLCLFSRPS